MFIGLLYMNLIKTLSLAVVGMALVFTSSAQAGRNLEREAANAQDRISSAEMNLQNVQRGMSERMDFIRDQNEALQADKKELASFQSGKNKYFGSPDRLRELQKSIAQREGDLEKARITCAELKRAEQKYETQRRSASAELYRINEDIKRDNGGSPGVREISRRLISTTSESARHHQRLSCHLQRWFDSRRYTMISSYWKNLFPGKRLLCTRKRRQTECHCGAVWWRL